MAGGFGFSISDLKLLTTFVSKVHQALKEEGGSASEYLQATSTLQSLRITLEQIEYSLHTGNPSFRNAVRSQLESQRLFIAEFNERLLEQYGDKLGGSTGASRTHGALCKVKWAFAATEDLRTFWMELLRRLEIVKLLMSSEIRTEVAGVSSSLQELRVLMSEVFQGQTIVKDAGQYLGVQDHIDNLRQEVREVRRDAVAPLPETSRDSQHTSLKSRHHATRLAIKVIDSTGATLEASLPKLVRYFQIVRMMRVLQHSTSGWIPRIGTQYIRFEDFFGQVYWLDTLCFVHFEVLMAFVAHKYITGSGSRRVKSHGYQIHTEGRSPSMVNTTTWDKDVLLNKSRLIMCADAGRKSSITYTRCSQCQRAYYTDVVYSYSCIEPTHQIHSSCLGIQLWLVQGHNVGYLIHYDPISIEDDNDDLVSFRHVCTTSLISDLDLCWRSLQTEASPA